MRFASSSPQKTPNQSEMEGQRKFQLTGRETFHLIHNLYVSYIKLVYWNIMHWALDLGVKVLKRNESDMTVLELRGKEANMKE